MSYSRRDFLKISATNTAMVIAISMPSMIQAKKLQSSHRSKHDTWDIYLTIHSNNQIEIASPVQDMGQHMKTTGPMLIAEELDADWSLVSCTAAATYLKENKDQRSGIGYRYASMDTGGSHALRNNWDYLRQAGATARYMLREAAAKTWKCPIGQVSTDKSYLIRTSTNQRLSYGEVAEIAALMPAPQKSLELKAVKDFSIIGRDTKTVDIDQIITGKPLFGIDMDYPGQRHAVVARCPYYQGKVKSYDDKAALKIKGVRSTLLIEPRMSGSQKMLSAGVAVIADSFWSAMKARKLLKIEWQKGPWDNENTAELKAGLSKLCEGTQQGKVLRKDGDINKGFAKANKTFESEYSTPFFHHACMEPFNCIADIRSDSATIVVGHQSPEYVATTVAEVTGLNGLKVEVQSHRMGGGFGRRWSKDFVAEAAIISQKIKSPVKVTWTREDEMEQDYFAPMQVTKIKAGLDKTNKITSWHYKHGRKRGGAHSNCFPANLIPNYQVEVFSEDCGTPVGAWRGPGHLQYTFATESMIDELAHKVSIDPFVFRSKLFSGKKSFDYKGYGATSIDAGRMLTCYQQAAKMADWDRARAKGVALGIAGHFTFGTYTAFVVEVDTTQSPNYRVSKCWGAIDCGLAVNPNHIRNQMEGGFIDGLNAAMFNQSNIQGGRVLSTNFDKLAMIKMAESPMDVEVAIIKNDHPPTGVGEPPTAPAAAALANALFAATGQRLRHLPLKLEA